MPVVGGGGDGGGQGTGGGEEIAVRTSEYDDVVLLVRMRADTYILLIYLSFAIFGSAEKNDSTFVATHEWQTVKKGELCRSGRTCDLGLLYVQAE